MSDKQVKYSKGLRIGTRCENVDDFIQKFYRFCEGSMIFIPHAKRSVGVDTAFSFDLPGGHAVLCGAGVVLEELPSAENRFGRPGIVVEVTQLQADSRLVFEQMSTMQRTRGTSSPPFTTTPPSTTPGTPGTRTPTPIPGYRPRAVTSAIELHSAVAIAKQRAAEKSGGLLKNASFNPAFEASNVVPSVAKASPPPPTREPEPDPRAATVALVEAAARSPRPTPPQQIPVISLPEPDVPEPPGGIDDLIAHVGLPTATPPGPVGAVQWDASGGFDPPSGAIAATTHADPAPPVGAGAQPSFVMSPTSQVDEPGIKARRLLDAARARAQPAGAAMSRLFTALGSRSRAAWAAAARAWRGLSPRRRLLVGAGAGGTLLVLILVLTLTGSKAPSPSTSSPSASPSPPAAEPADPGSAEPPPSYDDVVQPAMAEPEPKPAATKKRVTTKRVMTKSTTRRVVKKTVVTKPAAKPTAK